MRKVSFLIVAFILLFNICPLGKKAKNNSDVQVSVQQTREGVFADIIMGNISDWECVSDEYTREHTFDELDVSAFYLFSTDKQNEFYFVTGYTLKNQGSVGFGSDFSYGRVYYLTESSFEYMYNSGDAEYYEMVKSSRLFGSETFPPETEDKREVVESFLAKTLLEADKYYAEINLGETETISLSKDDTELFNNMHNTIAELEIYVENSYDLPLAKIKYYNLGDGKCEALFYYGSNLTGYYTVVGYYIDENGYSDLSDEDEEKLENTTDIETLEWNTDWTDEKKEYMLKKSIA